MKKKHDGYAVVMPSTPGAQPTIVASGLTLRDARGLARESWRRDLTHQDIRIEHPDGRLREYGGPAR